MAVELGRVRKWDCGAVGEGVDVDGGGGGCGLDCYEGRDRGIGAEGGGVGPALLVVCASDDTEE